MLEDFSKLAGPGSTRITLPGRRMQVHTVQSYGFIERFEIHPEEGLLPNMDAAAPYQLQVALIAPSGQTVPVNVTVVCRDLAPLPSTC